MFALLAMSCHFKLLLHKLVRESYTTKHLSHLVKHHRVEGPRDIDRRGIDAKDALLLETHLSQKEAGCHDGRQRRGDDNREDVQRLAHQNAHIEVKVVLRGKSGA